jgi:hypothetical protein
MLTHKHAAGLMCPTQGFCVAMRAQSAAPDAAAFLIHLLCSTANTRVMYALCLPPSQHLKHTVQPARRVRARLVPLRPRLVRHRVRAQARGGARGAGWVVLHFAARCMQAACQWLRHFPSCHTGLSLSLCRCWLTQRWAVPCACACLQCLRGGGAGGGWTRWWTRSSPCPPPRTRRPRPPASARSSTCGWRHGARKPPLPVCQLCFSSNVRGMVRTTPLVTPACGLIACCIVY